MLPGYVQEADIDTAILALQFELEDIAAILPTAALDSATALRSRSHDIQQSLQVLRDRQVDLRQDPRGATTAAVLQRLPPRQGNRAATSVAVTPTRASVRPQAVRIEPASTIPRPFTADIIIKSPAPAARLRPDARSPAPATQPERMTATPAAAVSMSNSSTANISTPATIHPNSKPTPPRVVAQEPQGLSQENFPVQTAQATSSANTSAAGSAKKSAAPVVSSKTNVTNVLTKTSGVVPEDTESKVFDTKIATSLKPQEPSRAAAASRRVEISQTFSALATSPLNQSPTNKPPSQNQQ